MTPDWPGHGLARVQEGDFLGGRVIKNPPFNARDLHLIPGPGTKTPHAGGQLNLRTAATEPDCESQLERPQ